jgi:hypothetical protein
MLLKAETCILKTGQSELYFAKLKPEEKVELAVSMTDACVRMCADGIRDRQSRISERELIEQVRERLMFMK